MYTVVMIDQKRALQLLGSGLGPTEVGTTLGCDPSYISQLLMDESFKQEVLVLRMKALQANTERDLRIDDLEDVMLEKLKEQLQWVTKPRELLQAFAVFNAAKRRGARAAGGVDGMGSKIVAILLPVAARTAFVTNAASEVVQIGDQNMTTMPLQSLMKQRLQERKANAVDALTSNADSKAAGTPGQTTGAKAAA